MTVSTALPLDQCAVCKVSGVNDTQTSCHASLSLLPEEEVKLLFNCSQTAEQAFTVTIARTIGEFTDGLMMHTVNWSMVGLYRCGYAYFRTYSNIQQKMRLSAGTCHDPGLF